LIQHFLAEWDALFTQAQFADEAAIAIMITDGKILQQAVAISDHHQQTAAGRVVFLMRFQVFREMIDPLGQQRDLDIGRAGVAFMQMMFLNNLRFDFFSRHDSSPRPPAVWSLPWTGLLKSLFQNYIYTREINSTRLYRVPQENFTALSAFF
jgi:hypothetical protein